MWLPGPQRQGERPKRKGRVVRELSPCRPPALPLCLVPQGPPETGAWGQPGPGEECITAPVPSCPEVLKSALGQAQGTQSGGGRDRALQEKVGSAWGEVKGGLERGSLKQRGKQ